jgi:hemerythrin-like domain-containing protein
MAIPLSSLGARPVGFDQPFEMMEACHERLHRMLELLARLRGHLRAHGADDQARQAARDVMKYFDQAAPQHHRDEELHVFPPLLAGADEAMLQIISRLQQDHLQMESRWATARGWLDAVARGELGSLTPRQEADLDAFSSLYATHIEAEEGVAYPAAREALGEDAVKLMGQEMATRRGAK